MIIIDAIDRFSGVARLEINGKEFIEIDAGLLPLEAKEGQEVVLSVRDINRLDKINFLRDKLFKHD